MSDEFSYIPIRQIMSRELVSVPENAPLIQAVQTMAERSISCVVVQKKRRLLGILTERDIVKHLASHNGFPQDIKVGDVMTRAITTIKDDRPIQEAIAILKQRRFRRLPIVDRKGRLLGIVTRTDIVQASLAEFQQLASRIDNAVKTSEHLARVSQQKDEVLGMVSHDIRSPITSIFASAKMFTTGVLGKMSKDQKKVVDIILRQSKKMEFMMKDLLDLNAIEAGTVALQVQLFPLAKLIQEQVILHQRRADQKGIRLNATISSQVGRIAADPLRIAQVVDNLISNAVKYSSSGSKVLVSAQAKPGGVVLKVTDTGQGIPKEEIGKLFQPFSTTSRKPTAGEPTTGLGLAIVKKLIGMHGGRIRVRSILGKGTTFIVELPRRASLPREANADHKALAA